MNALYKRGFVTEAHEVFQSMYELCMDTVHSKIYPGIPEYFSLSGKGMYHYLTGAASWLFLTVLTEMYGVRGCLGDLILAPKLVPSQFDNNGKAAAATTFAGKHIQVEYINQKLLDYSAYTIKNVSIDAGEWPVPEKDSKFIKISRRDLLAQKKDPMMITVILG